MKKTTKTALLLVSGVTASMAVSTNSLATQIFNSPVITCSLSNTYGGDTVCGGNLPLSGSGTFTTVSQDTLTSGSVTVESDGDVNVKLKGAPANTTYCVYVGNWSTSGTWQPQYTANTEASCLGAIGTVTTGANLKDPGKVSGRVIVGGVPNQKFAFPASTVIGELNFAFSRLGELDNFQFTTGVVTNNNNNNERD